MGVDVSATVPTSERTATAQSTVSGREDTTNDATVTLPPLVGPRTNSPANNGRPTSSKKTPKTKPTERFRAQAKPRTPTPTTNNPRTPTPTLPPLPTSPHQLRPPTANAGSLPSLRVKLITYEPTYNSTFPCKLTALQVAALLKPFWADLLANQLKLVRRHVGESHLKKLDFNAASVRFAANADATPLHLCAQYGLLPMAKMLVGEFALAATLRNKVGSTPLHVACKFGKREMVSWLVDELHVPLDVPDAHQRLALDVAPFDTVDKCVLAPLQRQLAGLRQRETELVGQNGEARERLETVQLLLRRNAMALGDTESHASELQAQIEEVSALERHWHEQWQARNAVLDELLATYDRQKQELVEEEQRAQNLYEQEVKAVREEHERAQRELEELQTLVDTTQRELDRRRQLLVDQLGVFDASLREFGGSKDVQQWALATLLRIAHDESGVTAGQVDRTELLLREEPVAVIRHVLATFPTDRELHYEALELLVAVLRLYESSGVTNDVFVGAVVDSDLLLQLGDVLIRWYSSTNGVAPSRITVKTFEAMYLCLGLRRNAARVLAFCQLKGAQLTVLKVIEGIATSIDGVSSDRRPLLRYTARVLLTQAKYGMKNVLLKTGVVSTVFKTLRRISIEQVNLQGDTPETETEAVQYLFAALALLMASNGTSSGDTYRGRRGKCREPARIEDLTADADCIDSSIVLDCVQVCVLPFGDHPSAVPATLWAFKSLINLTQHGGATALHVREEMLREEISLDNENPLSIILRAVELGLSTRDHVNGHKTSVQAVLAGMDLLRIVWTERFDHEGRVQPTQVDVVRSVPEITIALVQHLLVESFVNAARVLCDLASSLHALTSIAQNAQNAAVLLTLHDTRIEGSVLQPILQWTIRYVDETGASYREPNLVALLVRVLNLFLLLTQARRHVQSALLQAASDSEVASFYRTLHAQSRVIGVCAVIKIFHTVDTSELSEPTPPEWTTLRALCSQIHTLTHCSC